MGCFIGRHFLPITIIVRLPGHFAGPTFGPYDDIQMTYGAHVKIHGPITPTFDDLVWSGDYFYYDGVYYGDLEIYAKLPKEVVLAKDDQAKAKQPQGVSDD